MIQFNTNFTGRFYSGSYDSSGGNQQSCQRLQTSVADKIYFISAILFQQLNII